MKKVVLESQSKVVELRREYVSIVQTDEEKLNSSAKVTLDPDLQKELTLPEAVLNVEFRHLEQSILEDSGLEPANARFLLSQVYGRPRGEAESSGPCPKEQLEGDSTLGLSTGGFRPIGAQVVFQEEEYREPWWSLLTLPTNLTGSPEEAHHNLSQILIRERQENLIPDPPRYHFKPRFFKRDLFVYALREDRRWTTKNIDLQLDFMDLPLLADVWMKPGLKPDERRKGPTTAKAAKAKILHKTSTLIERYYGIEIFLPKRVRMLWDLLDDGLNQPNLFFRAMLCATDPRRVAAQKKIKKDLRKRH